MSDRQKKKEQSKQQLLEQAKIQNEAIEALSDEELEEVAGGVMIANINTGMVSHPNRVALTHNVNTNTGAMMRPMNTEVATRNSHVGVSVGTTPERTV